MFIYLVQEHRMCSAVKTHSACRTCCATYSRDRDICKSATHEP